MPILETPPNPAPPTPPDESIGEAPVVRIQTRRFGELDHTELVRLLDTLDDERSKARFRESIYISLFFWIGVVAFLIFAPRYFPHAPRFVTPSLENKDHKVTNLSIPPDVQRAMEHAPRFKPTPKSLAPTPTAPKLQAPTPTAPKLQAPAPPAPKAPEEPAPQPAPQAAPQTLNQPAAPAQPPPVVQNSPLPTPRPQQNVAALPSAPAPSPTANRPNFGNPSTSARDMVRQAGQAPRGGGGSGAVGFHDAPSQRAGRGAGAGAEILSDTQGVNFEEYLKTILAEIRASWEPLIPEEARPPLNKAGETQIRITILPDGRLHVQDGVHDGMVLEDSTHDDAINRSCWGSITGVGQFPPLPSQFHGPELVLRLHYFVNEEPR